MSLAEPHDRLQLPATLESQLRAYRRVVWTIKIFEAASIAAFAVLAAFLCVFALDRVWDTPLWVRALTFVSALVGCAIIPWFAYRWIWRRRHLEHLANLLRRKMPHLGDRLLGIIELARSDSEQERSRTLCQAAIEQVAAETRHRNLREAAPRSRHKLWAGLAGGAVACVVGLLMFVPAAATNAWARFVSPWSDTPRYTFAAINQLPKNIYVPHGEPFVVTAKLNTESPWRPALGEAQLGQQRAVQTHLNEDAYQFEFPPQIDNSRLQMRIGDARLKSSVKPTLRPELTEVALSVTLPEYLGLPKPIEKDGRGGSISLLKGSRGTITASASRPLTSATIDGQAQTPSGQTVSSNVPEIDASRKLMIEWQDEFGLSGKEPFALSINALEDEAPTLSCDNLPTRQVVLDTEQLNFQVKSQDDYGIKQIGMVWRGVDGLIVEKQAAGERTLAAGGHEQASLDAAGSFTAKSLGIEPQPIELRVFAEDYFPGRERSYSPTYLLYVLNAEQHAIWMTEQLSRWHRQALEIRNREMQLYEANKELRNLSAEELDAPETRRRIENQAAAERANGRRLTSLATAGEELVKKASRNPEIGVGHLERWAEMLQILKDISANRMPTVADLLQEAAEAKAVAENQTPSNSAPQAGQVRNQSGGTGSQPSDPKKEPPPAVPQVVDIESNQQPQDKTAEQEQEEQQKKNPSGGKLGLPQTTLIGKAQNGKPCPAGKKMDEAIVKQEELLAEFEKIADELNAILANLEGSTLVKRLKAAARQQYKIGGRIGDEVDDEAGFGRRVGKSAPLLKELAQLETASADNVSLIMDDMQSYFERRRFAKFKAVLDDMQKQDVVGSLHDLSTDIPTEQGLSISQCEYWSDVLDRWAEDLVDPACAGQCPGGKTPASLPPSVVLEVLQILEGEMNLREETRIAEKARPALEADKHKAEAMKLSETQDALKVRVEKVTQRIRELPKGEQEFGKEIALLEKVTVVMADATQILARPDTGTAAIGAETEAIELLLQSKRINPKGGGGGGANPGGGGSGTTSDSALALMGSGVNAKEVREDRGISQSVGDTGSSLPEEFRAGLDEYFHRLDRPEGQ